MSKTHSSLSPSRLNMLQHCPCFESAPAGRAAIRGTAQHSVLEAYFKEQVEEYEKLRAELEEGEDEKVQFAIEWISSNTSDNRKIEIKLDAIGPDIEPIRYGYADILDLSDDSIHVVDYKSGRVGDPNEVTPQMAAYAIMAMRKYERSKSRMTLVYGKTKETHDFFLNDKESLHIVVPILQSAMDPERQPTLCQYCGWCKLNGRCAAFPQRVRRILKYLS